MTDQSKIFAENYAVLESINQKLQDEQNSPTIIDDLAILLEQASKSYNQCKERIKKAESFIAEYEKNIDHDNEN